MLNGHKKQFDFLKRKVELGQLSHAYLITGEREIGKLEFAKGFAEFLGCKFPDLMVIEEANTKDPKFGDGGEIKISQIREVQNFLAYKSYNGGFKIVIVNEAEKMNLEAQSCFLKTLEEPKPNTLLLLISSHPEQILPTIYSRCQQIKFFKPKNLAINKDNSEKQEKILGNLLGIMGADLAEKFKYVKAIDFEKEKIEDILKAVQKFFRHLLMVKIGTEKEDPKDKVFNKYSVLHIKKVLNLAEELNKSIATTNASAKLALEILLMEI